MGIDGSQAFICVSHYGRGYLLFNHKRDAKVLFPITFENDELRACRANPTFQTSLNLISYTIIRQALTFPYPTPITPVLTPTMSIPGLHIQLADDTI